MLLLHEIPISHPCYVLMAQYHKSASYAKTLELELKLRFYSGLVLIISSVALVMYYSEDLSFWPSGIIIASLLSFFLHSIMWNKIFHNVFKYICINRLHKSYEKLSNEIDEKNKIHFSDKLNAIEHLRKWTIYECLYRNGWWEKELLESFSDYYKHILEEWEKGHDQRRLRSEIIKYSLLASLFVWLWSPVDLHVEETTKIFILLCVALIAILSFKLKSSYRFGSLPRREDHLSIKVILDGFIIYFNKINKIKA